MKSKDQILLEEAYSSIQLQKEFLTEGISDKIASFIWQTFEKKFPSLAQTAKEAAVTLIHTKDKDQAIDIVVQGFSKQQTPHNEGLIDKMHAGVQAATKAAAPYVQSVQGLVGAGIDAVSNMSVGDLYKILDPNTYISLVEHIWPDLLQTFTTHFHEILSGQAPDDASDWANNPEQMFAKKAGIVILLALLAYGAKKYAQRNKNK